MTVASGTHADRPVDLREMLDRARRLAEDELDPRAEAIDREAQWPEESLRAVLAAGLGGLVVPVEHGGLGQGLYGLARACEELAFACSSTAICFGMHCVGSAVIAARATPDQAERHLVPVARGEHLTTLSLSEPGTGAHFYVPQTQLARVDDGFLVTGTKSFVTNGSHADSYVISTVAADPSAPPGEFSCVLVDGRADGMRWGEPWAGLGMRGNDSRTLELSDVFVPRRDLLGREGDQLWYVFEVIAPFFLTAMAGTYLGVTRAACEAAIEHVRARSYAHSGRRLASEPVVQHRVGVLWAQLERTRRLVYSAASRADAGDADAMPAILSSKAEVAEAATTVVNEAMTMMGGIAYRDNSRLARALRDVRAAHVMAPPTDLLRTWTGRALLGEPLLAQ